MLHGNLIARDESSFAFKAGDAAAGDWITVPDTHLLFHAEFKRLGNDLKLVGEDGQSFYIPDYFKHEHRAKLVSPEGAGLAGDIVEALAGPANPGQYAQAGTPQAAGEVVGRVVTVSGGAQAVRNGVAITLNTGDAILKGDVVQTGADGALAIIFTDSTTFNLTANARMVINEFVYDPNGSANSALINLVQGTISLVAGQVAKSGDMKVSTPVATMGIRGTAILVEIAADNGATKFSVMVEPSGRVGEFNLYDNATGALLGTVSNSTIGWVVRPVTPTEVFAQQLTKSAEDIQKELAIVQQVFQAQSIGQQLINLQDPNSTKLTNNNGGTQFVVSDGWSINNPSNGGQGTTTVKVTVIGGPDGQNHAIVPIPDNHPPEARPDLKFDANSAFEAGVGPGNDPFPGTPTITGNVLLNDSDPDGNPIFVISFQPASPRIYGTLTMNSAGAYTYELNNNDPDIQALAKGETKVIIFNYTISDSGGLTASSTLTITIVGTNDLPIVTADVGVHDVDEGLGTNDVASVIATASGTLAFSDVDLSDTHSVTGATLHNGTASWNGIGSIPADTITALGLALTASILTDSTGSGAGTIKWAFAIPEHLIDFLGVGQTLTAVYDITISDNNLATATQQVTIVIHGTNDFPNSQPVVISADLTGTLLEGNTLTLTDSGRIEFLDVDQNDQLHISHDALTNASLVWSGGTLTQDHEDALRAGFSLDQSDFGNSGIVKWTYTRDESDLDFLAEGETVEFQVTVKIDDHNGGITEQTVTITITGSNDAPVITSAPASADIAELAEANEAPGATISATGTFDFTDADITDASHVASVQSVAASGTTSGLDLTNNALKALLTFAMTTTTTDADGSFDWTFEALDSHFNYLGAGDTLTLTYTVLLTDDEGVTDTQTVTINIAGSNDAPVITSAPASADIAELAEANEAPGATISATGTLDFTDADITDASHVASVQSVVASGTTGGLDVTNNALKALLTFAMTTTTTDADGSFDWTFEALDSHFNYLGAGDTLTLTYTVLLTDDEGATDTQTVTINIAGSNDAPVITVGENDSDAADIDESNSGLTAGGTLSVADADVTNTVAASVFAVALSGTGAGSVPSGLDDDALKAMFTVDIGDVIDNSATGGTITWVFDSGNDAFDFLAANETLILTYTVRATDSDTAHATADQTVVITITGTNDAPAVTTSPSSLPAINEDSTPAGTSVATLLAGNYTDADGSDGLAGIALVGNQTDPAQGQWQYFDSSNWVTIVNTTDANGPAINNALLLSAATLLRFWPAADYNGPAPAINGYIVDTSYGTIANGTHVDLSALDTVGGATPYSAQIIQINGTVSPVNDAPLASGSATLAAINEDTANPPGAIVSSLFNGNFSDATDQVAGGSSANAFAGIAISSYSADGAKGAWQYSTDSGSNWTALGNASATAAITLAASTLLRFVPAADYNGAATALSAHLIETGTTITNGGTINLSTTGTGGETHYSAATIALNHTINPVNDAPVAGGDVLSSVAEDSGTRTISFASLFANDSKGPANESGQTLTITALTNIVGGTAVISGTDILFTPAANFNGNASFDYTVQDNGQTNGSDDFKIAVGSVSFAVTAVNDAPVNTVPVAQSVNEDQVLTFSVAGGNPIAISDIDVDETAAPNNTVQVSLAVTNGVLNAVTGTSATIAANGTETVTITGTPAQVRAALDGLTYRGNQDFNGAETLTVTTNDFGHSGGAAGATLTALGNDIKVNTTDGAGGRQDYSVVTTLQDGSGKFVVAYWDWTGGDGGGQGVLAQMYNADSSPFGSEFAVTGSGNQALPSIAALEGANAGKFIVTWQGDGAGTTDVFGRIYDASGNPVSVNGSTSAFTLSSTTAGQQNNPSVAATHDGGFVATWYNDDNAGNVEIYGRVFGADGTALAGSGPNGDGANFQINTTTLGTQIAPKVTVLSNDNIVVAWEDFNTRDVRARLFDDSGNALTVPGGNANDFQLPSPLGRFESQVSLTALKGGGFVAVWFDDLTGGAIIGRLFNNDGTAVGNSFQIDKDSTDAQQFPSTAALDDGGFVVVWADPNASSDGSSWAVMARVFDASGHVLSVNGSDNNILINTTTADAQFLPVVAARPGGGFVVTWTDQSDGDRDIRVRAFDFSATAGKTDTDTVAITVNPVNDAPELTDATLAAIPENSSNPAGQTVQDLFASHYFDADGDAFQGILVSSNSADEITQGVWQYSVTSGSTWHDVGIVDEQHALALATDALLRFLPAASFTGNPPSLEVHGVELNYTLGFSGENSPVTVDIVDRGGSTGISDLAASLTTQVDPVETWTFSQAYDFGQFYSDLSGATAIAVVPPDPDLMILNNTATFGGKSVYLHGSGFEYVDGVGYTGTVNSIEIRNDGHTQTFATGDGFDVALSDLFQAMNAYTFNQNSAPLDTMFKNAPIEMYGSSAGDNLIGGNVGDKLVGGSGDDSLSGGSGADTFVFHAGFGHDAITDFNPTEDFLEFDQSIFQDVVALLQAAQDDGHGNVVIAASANDTLTLNQVAWTDLNQNQSHLHIV